ncbi:hypothetical protein EGI26_12095 [Lacihabitans sp. CCS-44]|uniref:hypothetical protein n=1 Tax=Lacihabitans sp. CCS-44 TaxID=2487331 RepID=UPI0020CCBC35|nr:hypothetical protein [Lacihabitans sp. CCS-44]MCP9755899.1 hypothetical protein [Lacihabitans sp. CCS-44]
MERFKKILILVIILLLGISTGDSYARSLFSNEKAHARDGYNEFDSKKTALNIFLFSSEIEDVSEESSDEDTDSNEEFCIFYSAGTNYFTQTFKSGSNSATRTSSQLFTKLSLFIIFRNLRI